MGRPPLVSGAPRTHPGPRTRPGAADGPRQDTMIRARRLAMTRLKVNDARCEAVFASGLQRSDDPTAEAVTEMISRTVRQFGIRGCASQMAQEFGDHPEAALDRMRWVRQLVGDCPLGPPSAPRVPS